MQQFVLLELRERGKRGGTLCACVRSANAAVVAATTNTTTSDSTATTSDVRYGRADGAAPATAAANALVVLRRR